MKSKNMVWIALGVVAAVIIAWNLFKPAGGGIVDVDPGAAQTAIDQGAQVVDVRSEGEFVLGHIPGAINVPIDQFEAQAAGWDRGKTYLVYCATGSRSQTAIQIMQKLGFSSVRHLNAGIVAWPGELQKGEAAPASKIETSGKPVMIEFYTDS